MTTYVNCPQNKQSLNKLKRDYGNTKISGTNVLHGKPNYYFERRNCEHKNSNYYSSHPTLNVYDVDKKVTPISTRPKWNNFLDSGRTESKCYQRYSSSKSLHNDRDLDSFSRLSRPNSLLNIGVNCYLNAALQGISSCSQFVFDLTALQTKYQQLPNLGTFIDLVKQLNDGGSLLLEISQNPIFNQWNKPGQQDSYELLAHVINQVYNELRREKEGRGEIEKRNLDQWLQVPLPMRILLKYEIKCACGAKYYTPLQSELAFHVTIDMANRDKDLQILLDSYFHEDLIQDYECDRRGCTVKEAHQTARLHGVLPKTLCIHLLRIFWDSKKMREINDRVEFGNSLTMKKTYCFDGSAEDRTYGLKSVIVHSGDVSCEHYVCYKRFHRRWFYASDSSIHEVEEREVMRSQAYILFYENDL